MELTDKQIEQIKRDALAEGERNGFARGEQRGFIQGYVVACKEWTSGCIAAVARAQQAWEKRES